MKMVVCAMMFVLFSCDNCVFFFPRACLLKGFFSINEYYDQVVNLRVREGFNISDVTFAEPDAEEAGACDVISYYNSFFTPLHSV